MAYVITISRRSFTNVIYLYKWCITNTPCSLVWSTVMDNYFPCFLWLLINAANTCTFLQALNWHSTRYLCNVLVCSVLVYRFISEIRYGMLTILATYGMLTILATYGMLTILATYGMLTMLATYGMLTMLATYGMLTILAKYGMLTMLAT